MGKSMPVHALAFTSVAVQAVRPSAAPSLERPLCLWRSKGEGCFCSGSGSSWPPAGLALRLQLCSYKAQQHIAVRHDQDRSARGVNEMFNMQN